VARVETVTKKFSKKLIRGDASCIERDECEVEERISDCVVRGFLIFISARAHMSLHARVDCVMRWELILMC
jgi:hypothetical protein